MSTISDDFLRGTSNLTILKQLRTMSPHAKIIVRAEKVKDARAMYEAGADYVLLPRHLIAEQIRDLLRRVDDGTLDQARQAEQEALGSRQEVVA